MMYEPGFGYKRESRKPIPAIKKAKISLRDRTGFDPEKIYSFTSFLVSDNIPSLLILKK